MYKKINLILFSVILYLGIFPINVYAGSPNLTDAFTMSTVGEFSETAGYDLDKSEIFDSVSIVIAFLLSFLGVIFLVLLIYGGFLWMTARGNEQQVEKAKEVMYSAIIGLIIVLAAYSISYFVINNFTKGALKDV